MVGGMRTSVIVTIGVEDLLAKKPGSPKTSHSSRLDQLLRRRRSYAAGRTTVALTGQWIRTTVPHRDQPGRRGLPAQSPCAQARVRAKVQHMEEGYTQLGTVLIDQRAEDSEGDGVIVVGRFKGGPYDGVQLSYDAGRRNLYLTPEGALRLALLLAAAVERDLDIR
jgi:hypothetical protein